LAGQVADAVAKGLAWSPEEPTSRDEGAFFEPTVSTDVTPDVRAFHEELFGPVASSTVSVTTQEPWRLRTLHRTVSAAMSPAATPIELVRWPISWIPA